MLRRHTSSSLRRPLAGLLVCAMLLAQALGLAHRIQHGGGTQRLAAAAGADVPQLRSSWFATHHDAADCRLFDQLSHADAPGFELAPLPPADLPAALPQARQPMPPASVRCVPLARGPPAQA